MTITAWRIVKQKHAASAFSGEGARQYGGRWNLVGTSVIYAAGSISLATLEMLVHLRDPDRSEAYALISATFADECVEVTASHLLPDGWAGDPIPVSAQEFGTSWVVSGRSCVLRVPSAVTPTEFNYLINPAHTHFAEIMIGEPEQFRFDPRLFKS